MSKHAKICKRITRMISILMVLFAIGWTIRFYVVQPASLLMPKYMILLRYGLCNVIVPVSLFILAGILFYISKEVK